MTSDDERLPPDPVIEWYKTKVDMSALRENLKLTPQQRVDKLQRRLNALSDAEFAELQSSSATFHFRQANKGRLMPLAQSLLPEFDAEMASTRKVLERIPDDKLDWKAHPKSNSIQWVGTHLAQIPFWVNETLTKSELDIAPVGGEPYRTQPRNSRREIVELFDQHVASARAALVAASDDDLMKPWSLLQGGKIVFTMPKIAVVRMFVLNHSIHHRAILCVYLRLNDIPVPGLYGPPGDE